MGPTRAALIFAIALCIGAAGSLAAAGTRAGRWDYGEDARPRRYRSPPRLALGHRGLAALDGLAHLEALELRMIEIERLVLAGILMDGAERLRLRPRLERRVARLDRVRGIEREVVVLGSSEQVELDEAGTLVSCESRLSQTSSKASSDPFFTRKRFMAMYIIASPVDGRTSPSSRPPQGRPWACRG